MYILNSFGVMHTIPDDMALPAGARKATPAEVAAWLIADDTAKAAILADKKKKAANRAQMVVNVNSPSAFSGEELEEKPAKGKATKDAA